jgi:transcriptional regulator with XRE-family HTH domain/tetratricopeptide (TPR) repeat protein
MVRGRRRRDGLASARRAAGYTQEGLATELDIDRSTVIRWESGDHTPLPYLQPKLARLLGRSREQLSELIDGQVLGAERASAQQPDGPVQAAEPPIATTSYDQGNSGGFAEGSDREVGTAPTRREVFGYAGAGVTVAGFEQVTTRLPRAVQALEATRQLGRSDTDTVALDDLGTVVDHYKQIFPKVPPAELYDELLGVRVYAGRLLGSLDSDAASGNRDLLVLTCWLSNLLALATCDLKDHAASLVWCADVERWSRAAGHPELAGWAAQTRVLLSFYEGQAGAAVAQAQRGQALAPLGTVLHARLLVQEMRAWARLGNAEKVASMRRRAEKAIARLPANAPRGGAFSISLADDPPYTATSLLLLGRHEEAADVTRRIIAVSYGTRTGEAANPSGFARAHLILALSLAGSGRLDETYAAGSTALATARPVWPTMVLARRLDRVLLHDFAGTAEARDYHERYLSAVDESSSISGRGVSGPAS